MISLKPAMKLVFQSAALALLALVFAACGEKPEPGPAAGAPAKPALWRVGDADTTVYVFGTVHVLPPDLDWKSQAIDEALAASSAVYFETDIEPDRAAFIELVERLGKYDPSEKLSDHLSPEDLAKLKKSAEKLSLPMVYLEPLRPWYAAVTLSEQVIGHAGYEANSGVERKLAPIATAAGKEIRKLESIEQQMLAFADLPEEAQVRFLIDGLDDIDNVRPALSAMVESWRVGDLEKLEKILIEDDLGKQKAVYDALLVKRNERWAPEIDTLIRTQPGTFFIAVGEAHLIGKDSVFQKLKPLGYTADRLQ